MRLDGAVQHRVVRVVRDLFPVFRADAPGELVGIVGRVADHGQHFAIARVQRHHRPVSPLHGQLGHHLQVQVQRQLQAFARNGLLNRCHLVLVAAVVHHHLPLTVLAHQGVVVLPLDARLPDHVSLVVLDELGRVELSLADFPHVADHVRRQALLRVQTPLRPQHLHLGKGLRVAVGSNECQFARGQLVLDDDRFIPRPRPEALESRHQPLVIDSQPRRDRLDVLELQVVPRQDQPVRRVVVHDHPAVPVEDLAPRRRQR